MHWYTLIQVGQKNGRQNSRRLPNQVVKNTGIKVGLVSLLLIILAVPVAAKAYVDPGTGSMVWQMTAAAVIGSLFYAKRLTVWFRGQVPVSSPVVGGFLFATLF